MRKPINTILFFLVLCSCRQTYISPYKSPNLGYLVVEGVINSGAGNTTISLSRTTQLSDGTYVRETGATVAVSGQDNSVYPLTEATSGQYIATDLNLDPGKTYRLHIITSESEYLSDFVPVNPNPEIDSIPWNYAADGVHLFVNTHDPTNTAKYFDWQYTETWEFHSDFVPNTKFANDNPYFVTYFDPIIYYLRDSSNYKCWKSDTSQQFILGSTVKYAVDTISNPLGVVPTGSWKMSVLYSANVRQFTYTKDGFEFLQKMKKNTEQLGTVFDSQPSDLQGNIHNVSKPSEMVIGYVSCCPLREKRVFVNNNDLPNWNYSSGCQLYVQNNDPDFIKQNDYYADGLTAHILPVEYLTRNPSTPPPNGVIFTFSAANTDCVDCKLKGSGNKPDFWP